MSTTTHQGTDLNTIDWDSLTPKCENRECENAADYYCEAHHDEPTDCTGEGSRWLLCDACSKVHLGCYRCGIPGSYKIIEVL